MSQSGQASAHWKKRAALSAGGRGNHNNHRSADRPRQQGTIESLKEKFGFIKTLSRDADLFFHYEELDGVDANDLNLHDEVEFNISRGRDNRVSAARVTVLPKGTIEYDEIKDEQIYYGMVVQDLRKRNDRGSRDSFPGRICPLENPQSDRYGELYEQFIGSGRSKQKATSQEGVPSLVSFCERGYSSRRGNNADGAQQDDDRKKTPRLSTGDVVQYQVGIDKVTNAEHALNIVVLESCQKYVTDRIQEQLAGKEDSDKVRGVVTNVGGVPTNPGASRSRSLGTIQVMSKDVRKVAFQFRDLPEVNRPVQANDRGGHNASSKGNWRSESSTTGMYQDWRKDNNAKFGTASVETPEDTTLRKVHVGMPVEFHIIKDPKHKKAFLAAQITVLPEGSVVLEAVIRGGVTGKLLPGNAIELKKPIRLRDDQDDEQSIDQDEQTVTKVHFEASELISPGPVPGPGDIVACDVVKSNVTGDVFAVRVYLVTPASELARRANDSSAAAFGGGARETGVVTTLRESFGFVNCFGREGELFFPYNEVVASPFIKATSKREPRGKVETANMEPPFSVGDFVSFNVVANTHLNSSKNSRKKSVIAAAVVKVPKGSISPTFSVETGAIGVIETITVNSGKKRGGGKQAMLTGKVRYNPATYLLPSTMKHLPRFANRETLPVGQDEVEGIDEIHMLYVGSMETADPPFTRSPDDPAVLNVAIHENYFKTVKDYAMMAGLKVERIREDGKGPLKGVRIVRKVAGGRRKDKGSGTPDVSKLSIASGEKDTEAAETADDMDTEKVDHVDPEKANDTELVGEQPTADANMQMDGEESANPIDVSQGADSESSNDNNKGAKVAAPAPRKEGLVIPYSIKVSRDHFAVGDKVSFEVVFDKSKNQLVGRAFVAMDLDVVDDDVVEGGEEVVEKGIVACLKDEGFGFIQCFGRPLRVFMHVSQCQDAEYKEVAKPGDVVEFVVKNAKRGISAFKISLVDGNPDVVYDSVNQEVTERLQGFVVGEPKPLNTVITTTRADNKLAIRVAASQLGLNSMGKICVGETYEQAKPVVSIKDDIDWRREAEIRNRIRELENLDDADATATLALQSTAEVKLVRKVAKKGGLYVGNVVGDGQEITIAVAKSKDGLNALKKAPDASELKCEDGNNQATKEGGSASGEDVAAPSSKKVVYGFTSLDTQADSKGWVPFVGDQVEFTAATNLATGHARAVDIKIISSVATKQKGLIDGTPSLRYGFVRPLVAGEASKAILGTNDIVDESFKPGSGGRDGTVKFESTEVVSGGKLNDGDEVEYILVVDPTNKTAKAVRVKLMKRNPNAEQANAGTKERKMVNQSLIQKLRTAQDAAGGATVRFVQAKGPDGTNGFAPGRGRAPKGTLAKQSSSGQLRPDAKEFVMPGGGSA